MGSAKKLRNISEIRRFFHRNEHTDLSSSAPPTSTCSAWTSGCKNFKFINYIDCLTDAIRTCSSRPKQPHPEFGFIEDINNYLLQHKEVIDYIELARRQAKARLPDVRRADRGPVPGGRPRDLVSARQAAHRVDNKIETVRIGNKAGVQSVPNVLGRVEQLRRAAQGRRASFGPDLVVQTAFGDSGHTTFFISQRGRLPQAREGDRQRRRGQDHEAHPLPRLGDRSLRHPRRHDRRPA